MLDEASKHHPNTWWWLKADGCDVVSGLAESMRGTWSGYVDLNNGDVDDSTENIGTALQKLKT